MTEKESVVDRRQYTKNVELSYQRNSIVSTPNMSMYVVIFLSEKSQSKKYEPDAKFF